MKKTLLAVALLTGLLTGAVLAAAPVVEAVKPKYLADEPLMIMKADGSQLRNWIVVPGYETYGSPMVSRDGSKVAFEAQPSSSGPEATHIFIANLDGSSLRDLGVGASPTWSPNDQRIAFHRYGSQAGIWAVNTDGTGEERLTTNGIAARWSPDGTEIAYIGSPGASGPVLGSTWSGYGNPREQPGTAGAFCGLCSFSTLDGGQRPLVKDYDHGIHPGFHWSPDGSRLAFVGGHRDMSKELVIVSGQGEKQRLHIRLKGDIHLLGTNLCWTADGKKLLLEYNGANEKPRQLYFVEVDSKEPPVLVPGQDPDRISGDMTLSRDGTQIIFASYRLH